MDVARLPSGCGEKAITEVDLILKTDQLSLGLAIFLCLVDGELLLGLNGLFLESDIWIEVPFTLDQSLDSEFVSDDVRNLVELLALDVRDRNLFVMRDKRILDRGFLVEGNLPPSGCLLFPVLDFLLGLIVLHGLLLDILRFGFEVLVFKQSLNLLQPVLLDIGLSRLLLLLLHQNFFLLAQPLEFELETPELLVDLLLLFDFLFPELLYLSSELVVILFGRLMVVRSDQMDGTLMGSCFWILLYNTSLALLLVYWRWRVGLLKAFLEILG